MASLDWAAAVLPSVWASTKQPRCRGRASSVPMTHVTVSFVQAGLASGALGAGVFLLWASGFPFSKRMTLYTNLQGF